jgi:hypothetical protein
MSDGVPSMLEIAESRITSPYCIAKSKARRIYRRSVKWRDISEWMTVCLRRGIIHNAGLKGSRNIYMIRTFGCNFKGFFYPVHMYYDRDESAPVFSSHVILSCLGKSIVGLKVPKMVPK